MTIDQTIRAQGYQYFLQEAPELLQVLEQGLLTLQEDSSINKVNTLMRATHTLKGAAASLELETIAKVAHSLEDVFRALCRPEVSIDAEADALLFEGFECLRLALRAELTEATINEDEILNQTATIFAQLQDYLGDCFDQSTPLPTSAELGFDVTQSIFEVGVTQRLTELAAALDTAQPAEVLATLQTQAEVFLGLAESLNLPGFGAIAEVAIAAVEQNPDQGIAIAQLALQDFQAGQAAVLAGDRTQGGQPSAALQALTQPQPNQAIDYTLAALAVEDPSSEGVVREPEQATDLIPEALDLSEHLAAEDEVATEITGAGDIQDAEKSSETPSPGIHKLFQWMRRSVQPSPEPVGSESEALPAPPESFDESTSEPDEIADLFSEQPGDIGDAVETNARLEDIWGGAVSSGPQGEPDPSAAALTVSAQMLSSGDSTTTKPESAIAPTRSEAATEPEELELKPAVPPHPPIQQPTPFPNRGGTPPAPTMRGETVRIETVRIEIEHLDQLNYVVGELLTNHNRQSLQAEQIQTAMRHLYARLEQHQHLLTQLQDWIDSPLVAQNRSQNDDGLKASPGPAIASPFQVTPLGSGQSPLAPRALPIGFDALELDQYSEPQLVIQSLLDDTVQLSEAVDAVELFTRQSRQAQEQQGRLLFKTRDTLIEGRMFPLGQLFERFPRVLQQLETLHHKPVELALRGTEVLVDKAIGEKLYDPILHLVRNAFDHGIEPVALRQQRGKPTAGQLEIVAHHQGKHLVIEVRDDGQGIDFERIRQQAVERQMVSPQQAHRLSQAQLTDLLFEPGFSTAGQISSLSGRGVGLDVVRNQLQALQGEIAVTSTRRQGTTFTLRIPLSLTIAKLLLCQAAARTYALLPDAVEQIIIPKAGQLQQREHCRSLWWGDGEDARLVPIYALSALLDYPAQAQPPTQAIAPSKDRTATPHILLIRHQDSLVGLEVDQMLGEQELVIRPLSALVETHSYLYGASILADGRLTLVLDGATLVESASGGQPEPESASPPAQSSLAAQSLPPSPELETGTQLGQKLLVVDDSITTRQTLTLTLQRAGYQVIQAQDGQEAVDQLQHHANVQLVICDVEMPRMNGFEFLQHCQQVSAGIPVAMLSSRSSDKHRFLAEQLGAIAYISKPYLEHQLLAMVAEVLEVEAAAPVSS